MRRRRIIILAGLAVALGSVPAAAALLDIGPWRSPAPPSPDRGPVIAQVDGEPIYLSQARSRVQGLASVHQDLEKTMGPDWHDELLQSLVDDVIVRQQAASLGIVPTDQEVQSHLERIRAMFGTQEGYQEWLTGAGLTEQDLVERVRLQVMASRVYTEVTSDVELSRDVVRAYYDKHRDDYPGVDGDPAPFPAVRTAIEEKLLAKRRDATYKAWLSERREEVDVVVLMEDWWEGLV